MAQVDELFWALKADISNLTKGVGAAQGTARHLSQAETDEQERSRHPLVR